MFLSKQPIEEKYTVYTRDIKSLPVSRSILNGIDLTDISKELALTDSATSSGFSIKNLSSRSVYIYDVDSDTTLFEKNGELLLLPASTTKIMTALVAREEYNLDDILTVPDVSEIEGFRVGLFDGEQLQVRELLKAALIQSSNDAAYVLAINHPSGLSGFVDLMNKKAVNLGLRSTLFENPAGFDNETQKSSARDLVIMSKEFMNDEFLKSIVSTKEDTITDSTGEYTHSLYNTHQLLGSDPSVVGIKTGTTDGANQVLVTQFNREGHNIIVVIMGSDDRYLETSQLIDWVFDEFIWLTPQEIFDKS